MKKIHRVSQFNRVMGNQISGLRMHKYGMPYRNAGGHIFPKDEDLVDRMLVAVEMYPELHVVTFLNDDRILNRYEAENASAHYLFLGNNDPEIEFSTEFSMDDFSEEEITSGQKRDESFQHLELTPVQIAAIGFAMNAVLKGGK